jgi:hypothetical protein
MSVRSYLLSVTRGSQASFPSFPGRGGRGKSSCFIDHEQHGQFRRFSHYNGVDLGDFFALSGADSTRSVQEVIFVAAADSTGQLNEHSLLASGNFDRDRIYRSAVDSGSSTTRYRGVSVLVVQPFAREPSAFSEVRWLAILSRPSCCSGLSAVCNRSLTGI